MPKLFNFEFTIEHEEMTEDEKRKAEDKLETVFNEIFGDEWIGCYDWDYNPQGMGNVFNTGKRLQRIALSELKKV